MDHDRYLCVGPVALDHLYHAYYGVRGVWLPVIWPCIVVVLTDHLLLLEDKGGGGGGGGGGGRGREEEEEEGILKEVG